MTLKKARQGSDSSSVVKEERLIKGLEEGKFELSSPSAVLTRHLHHHHHRSRGVVK